MDSWLPVPFVAQNVQSPGPGMVPAITLVMVPNASVPPVPKLVPVWQASSGGLAVAEYRTLMSDRLASRPEPLTHVLAPADGVMLLDCAQAELVGQNQMLPVWRPATAVSACSSTTLPVTIDSAAAIAPTRVPPEKRLRRR